MKNLFELLESFVLVYLPLERGYSKETSKSYYTAIKQFINYLIDTTNIKQEKLSVTDFTRVNISSYLLEIDSQGKSISTRNQRLSALVSFVLYCAMIEPIYQNTLSDVKQIKLKKNIRKKLDYLTVEEYKALISTVDLKSKNGLRHYTILNLLYDTAARVSEFINIKVEDLNYGSNNSIKVYGKGKRYRVIYISDHTVNLIRDYMNKYHITSGYLFINNRKEKLSRYGIYDLVKKYYQLASETTPTLKQKTVSPHTLRHTKACHFLINGTAIPVIQKFLGHSSVQTTEIYLEVTSSAVIDAVEKASTLIVSKIDNSVDAAWKDDDIMRKIDQLFKHSD